MHAYIFSLSKIQNSHSLGTICEQWDSWFVDTFMYYPLQWSENDLFEQIIQLIYNHKNTIGNIVMNSDSELKYSIKNSTLNIFLCFIIVILKGKSA